MQRRIRRMRRVQRIQTSDEVADGDGDGAANDDVAMGGGRWEVVPLFVALHTTFHYF